MIKVYMLLLVLGLIGGVGYGAWYYYNDTQERIRILTENSAKLETAKLVQDQTIQTMIDDRKQFEILNRDLQGKLELANTYRNTLIDKLRKHDLARLSMQKPALVEKKINGGTKKLFDSFERITGGGDPK